MKTLAAVLLLIMCISLNAQKGKLILSCWHENGNSEMNIPSDKYFYFEKGKLYYFLSNDHENIYLDMKIEDPGVQNRILKEGLTVWINMDSKSIKKMGVRFPMGSQYSGSRKEPNKPDVKLNADGSLVTPLSRANTIELIGFPNIEGRHFPADNPDTFRGSVKFDNAGALQYKMLMPISKLPVRNSKNGVGAMPFYFGIEYGILAETNGPLNTTEPMPSSQPAPGRSRGGSRGGSRSGGGSQVGSSQVSRNPGAGAILSQNTIPPVLFWIKNIKLATNK